MAGKDCRIGRRRKRRGGLDGAYQRDSPAGISIALHQGDITDPSEFILVDLHLALEERRTDRRPGPPPSPVDPGMNLADIPAVERAER